MSRGLTPQACSAKPSAEFRLGGRKQFRLSVNRGYEPGFFVLTRLLGGETEHVRPQSAAPVMWMRQ